MIRAAPLLKIGNGLCRILYPLVQISHGGLQALDLLTHALIFGLSGGQRLIIAREDT